VRRELDPSMERARHLLPDLDDAGSGPQGAFRIAPFGMRLNIIASDGRDWIEAGLPLPIWEHVSVSLANRTPTWREMEWVRDQFWEPDELVVQFSVPREQHVSWNDFTLHMWKPLGVVIPLPPSITVAPAKART